MSKELPATRDLSFANIFDELQWRGLVYVSTDESAMRALLASKGVGVYCGFDPTAPSLHLGNLLQLLLLRRLQLAGCRVFALVGGSTGLVGDPRPTAERTLNSKEIVKKWSDSLKLQIESFLDFDGDNPAQIVNNYTWTKDITAIEFLRDIGKHFRINTMLKKDAVAARLNSTAGISYTEFSYQILQAYDFWHLFKTHSVVLQTGGSDQWGNLTAGIDLIHKMCGKSAFALGTPLIVNSDGSKFGKTENGAIWLDTEKTSPYSFYQFWLNVPDADVINLLKLFTFLSREEIDELDRKVQNAPHKREAQKHLALLVTGIVHGTKQAHMCRAAALALFGSGSITDLSAQMLEIVAREVECRQTDRLDTIVNGLVKLKLCATLSEARRVIEQGGVYVNNINVRDANATVDLAGLLDGGYVIIRRGKKSIGLLQIV